MFLSKTRGLVAYDAGADAFSAVAPDDGRIAGCAPAIPTAEAHVVFGYAYLLLRILEKSGLLGCVTANVVLTNWDCGGDPGPKRGRKEAACS
ncbi:MAG: hypothetical protein ACI361_00395, partial [Atopobiaceae bacterium]